MANKHMERGSTSYVIRGIQINTTEYHYTPIRMAKIQNTGTKFWLGCEAMEAHSLLVRIRNGTATFEDSLVVSDKTKHTLTTQSSNHILWYLPKGAENLCPHKT